MTLRQYLGCAGLLAAFAVGVVQAGCTPAERQTVKDDAAKVAKVVQDARAAGGKTCDRAVPVCALYFDAVRVGLVPGDDRAELACAKVANVCALLGAGGAP